MHRIKTWARRKAQSSGPRARDGRRPSLSAGGASLSQSRSRGRSSGRNGPGVGASGLGGAAELRIHPSPAELGGGIQLHEDGNGEVPEKRGVVSRFFATSKAIIFSSYLNILLVFVPVGIAAHFAHLNASIIFAMNAIAIVPLAGLLSHATESVAKRMGDAIGALMNVTFGNAVELIIFIIALVKNEIRIVQASLLGSILANLLLILGMCFFLGGMRYREQMYNSTVTQMSACLLSLSVVSLLLPTAFHASFSNMNTADDKVLQVSRGTSVILLLVYLLYLAFQLKSHAYMYESTPQHIIDEATEPGPAANFLNSSSSSESSSSSSSSTDSSHTTRKRFKRAVRRATSRKHSIASQETNNEKEKSPPKPATPSESATPGNSMDVDAIQPIPSETQDTAPADDEGAGDGNEERRHRKKHRKHHKKHGHSHSSSAAAEASSSKEATNETHTVTGTTAANPTASNTTAADPNGEPKRVDFAALGVDLEAQTPAPPKPFSLRNLRPAIPKTISQTVFSPPPPRPNSDNITSGASGAALLVLGGPSAVAAAQISASSRSQSSNPRTQRPGGPRRANSLPAVHSMYRMQPGAIPPINPVVVDSTPRRHHRTVVAGHDSETDDDGSVIGGGGPHEISRTTAVVLLLVSTGLVALCAEFMVDAISEVVEGGSGSISEAFIGLILLPIVGNAAEHTTAVTVAMKNKMDLAIGVALGSSIQIAIFITPLVVILGWIMGKEMSLYFTLFETVSMFVSAFIVNFLVLDGRSNYLEGALLCSAYVIIAVAAFFYPNAEAANLLGGGDSDDGGAGNATGTSHTVAAIAGRMVADQAVKLLLGGP